MISGILIGAFFVNYCYIPRLFSLKKASADFDDDGETESVAKSKKIPENSSSNDDSDEALALEGEEDSCDQKEEKIGSDGDRNDQPEENEGRGRFEPFFFLDHVVT